MSTQQGTRRTGQPVRVLVVTPFETPQWRWLSGYFPRERFSWEFMNGNLYGRRPHAWALHAWRAAKRARDVDLVISHHPYMTLWTAAALCARRMATPHLAFSFNHGNKRFFTGPLLWLAKRVLPSVSLFNVLSAGERVLFNKLYDIPLNKMRFSHWAVQPPSAVDALPPEYEAFQPYICAMGRNNRDFTTFLRATESLPINVVVVCSRRDAPSLPTRSNVKVISEITLDESLRILDGALFSVVPLLDNTTGAGHMTFVHAMHLGKPQVATDVENTSDYFIGGVHGYRVPPRDVDAMRGAVRRLLDDHQTRSSFGSAAKAFADRWLTEAAAAQSARQVLETWADGKPIQLEPEGWAAYLRGLDADHSPPATQPP